MQTLMMSLNEKTGIKGILEIITAATEFEDIQIRRHEDHVLGRIYDRVPYKMQEPNFETPHFKAFVLLQAHFSRMQLPIDLAKDQEFVVRRVHLNAMNAMELSQMVVQAMWQKDSPLKQIPHFDDDTVNAAKKFGISDIYEFMDAMDPDENPQYKELVTALGLDNKQLSDAATFTNEYYPNVDLAFEVLDPETVTSGEPAYLSVSVTRELDEEEEPKMEVHAPFYPSNKSENFWLVVGDQKQRTLLAIKKVTVGREWKGRVEYTVMEPGEKELTLFLVSDSYLGVDQAPTFKVQASEGMDEDEESEGEEE
jgi:pre-mRNA-splicing helicase BRR2